MDQERLVGALPRGGAGQSSSELEPSVSDEGTRMEVGRDDDEDGTKGSGGTLDVDAEGVTVEDPEKLRRREAIGGVVIDDDVLLSLITVPPTGRMGEEEDVACGLVAP